MSAKFLPAVLDDDDPVGELDGLQHVVRHEQHGLLRPLPDRLELLAQLPRRDRVEVAERLVHQQEVGLDRERAGDPHALLHPAGEMRRDTSSRTR